MYCKLWSECNWQMSHNHPAKQLCEKETTPSYIKMFRKLIISIYQQQRESSIQSDNEWKANSNTNK